MSNHKRCPTCNSVMEPHDSVLKEDLTPDIKAGAVLTFFHCPSVEGLFHTYRPCSNCGEDVWGPQQHWTSRNGLIGSGRWTCVSVYERERAKKFFDNLLEGLDEAITTPINDEDEGHPDAQQA